MIVRSYNSSGGSTRLAGVKVGDVVILMLLNVLAAYVSWGYTGAEIPVPDLYAWLHFTAAVALFASCFSPKVVPFSLAITTGVFVGRSLGLLLALLFHNTDFPAPTVILAAMQWFTLAWIIRPSSLLTFDAYVMAEELHIDKKSV